MKNSKKGISLIVLVITIIVIIILAAAVLLSLNANNPISNAKQATFDSDVDNVRSAINLYIGDFMAKNPVHEGPFDPNEKTGKVWIYVGEGGTQSAEYPKDDAKTEEELANEATTYGDQVTWEDLGLSGKPNSIKAIAYNCKTCAICAIPAQGGVEYTFRLTADAEEATTVKNTDDLATVIGSLFYTPAD